MAEPRMSPDPVDVSATLNVTLAYDMEGNQRLPKPYSFNILVTSDLARVFARAHLINTKTPPPLSFSSLLMAMMVEDGSVSGWLKQYLLTRGLDLSKIASHNSRSSLPLRMSRS